MPKITLETPISETPGLSPESVDRLFRSGIVKFSDLEEVDFARATADLSGARERKALYQHAIKSGVSFLLDKELPLADVPGVSARAVKALAAMGISRLSDFEQRYIPEIYDRIGYGLAKPMLVALSLSSVRVRFANPNWSEDQWRTFIEGIVQDGLVSWEDVAVAVCSELNPPQVGTQVANAVKHNYPPRKTMQEVFKWFYNLDGKCAVSGKRIFLEADHKKPREYFIKTGKNVKDADTLDNHQLLTKRENVTKRGSHKLGGLSFAPAAAMLVYILLSHKPDTFREFVNLCRSHGLTMSEIRMSEAWALAVWLNKEGKYDIRDNALPPISPEEESDELDV